MSSWWWRSHPGWSRPRPQPDILMSIRFPLYLRIASKWQEEVWGGAEMSVFLILRMGSYWDSCDMWWLMTWSGWWLKQPDHVKYDRQIGSWNPKDRGEHKKSLSCHHLVIFAYRGLSTQHQNKLGCSLRVTHHGYGCSHLQRKSLHGFSDGKLRHKLAGLNWKRAWPTHNIGETVLHAFAHT